MKQLLDSLAIETCVVVGISGGGPYALICAAEMPERIKVVGLISSGTLEIQKVVSTRHRLLLWCNKYMPLMGEFVLGCLAAFAGRNPSLVSKLMTRGYAPADTEGSTFGVHQADKNAK